MLRIQTKLQQELHLDQGYSLRRLIPYKSKDRVCFWRGWI
jgi:hypothetical protein